MDKINSFYIRDIFFLIGISLCISFAFPAYSDMGTSLMIAHFSYLYLWNVVIGIIEGLILWKFFRAPLLRALPLAILGNAFAAWIGVLTMYPLADSVLSLNIYNLWRWFIVLVFVTFIFTALLELPFIVFAFRKNNRTLKKSIKADIVVQLVSYISVGVLFGISSQFGLYQHASTAKYSDIKFDVDATLYYISQDGVLTKHRLGSDESEKATTLPYQTELNTEKEESGIHGFRRNIIPAIDLRPEDQREWTFRTESYMYSALIIENPALGRKYRIALEVPFARWSIYDVTVLPGDQVIFQLGENQICVYDRETAQIALISYGRDPVVVLGRE